MKRQLAILCCLCLLLLAQGGCRTDADTVRAEDLIAPDAAVPDSDLRRLQAAGWKKRVGRGMGLWVSVARQQLIVIKNNRVRQVLTCSTAAKGTGNRQGSYRTPLGWHKIDERYGGGLPKGAVFVSRKYTGRVWSPDKPTSKDLILSRIMWLRGLEPGLNSGKGIDSHDRYIYIHGTPEEHKLGTPASMGCVRLSNEDVIKLYKQARKGTPVLITKW